MAEATHIPYRLALTRVVISGTSETEAHPEGRLVVSASASVELRTAADPHDWLTLELPDKAAEDRSFTLKLTDDGRVASTDTIGTGRVGSAVKSLVSGVTSVAGVALGVLSRGGLVLGALAADEQPRDWRTENPVLADRRASLNQARDDAHAAVLAAQRVAIEAGDPRARRDAMRRATDLQRVVVDIERQLRPIEEARTAWLKAQADRRSERHTFIMDVNDLPTEEDVAAWPTDTAQLTPDTVGAIHPVLFALGLVITRRDITKPSTDNKPKYDGTAYEAVWYRRPRQVELGVYRVVGVDRRDPDPTGQDAPSAAMLVGSLSDPDNPDPVAVAHAADRADEEHHPTVNLRHDDAAFVPVFKGNGPVPWLTLIEHHEVEVVDGACAYSSIPFKTVWFGERTAKIDFGPLGSPVSVGSTSTSVLKDLAEMVGELPQQVLTGLEAANKIVDQGEVASRQAADRRLVDLQRRASILEQELLIADTQATAPIRSELALVNAEHDLLTGRRDLESITRELALQRETSDAWYATQLDDIANDLLQEKVDRLELQAKVADLNAELATSPLELAATVAKLRAELDRLELIRDRIAEGVLPDDPLAEVGGDDGEPG